MFLHNSIFKPPYVIKRHSMTSLMMSLKFINISNTTYCFATAQKEFLLHKVYALLSYAKFGTFFLRHPVCQRHPLLYWLQSIRLRLTLGQKVEGRNYGCSRLLKYESSIRIMFQLVGPTHEVAL